MVSATLILAVTVCIAFVSMIAMIYFFCARRKVQRDFHAGASGRKKVTPARQGRAKVGVTPEMDRRFQGGEDEGEFVGRCASSSMIGRVLSRAKSIGKTPEHKLSLSRHDSALSAGSWQDLSAQIEMQPEPGHLTSLFPAAGGPTAAESGLSLALAKTSTTPKRSACDDDDDADGRAQDGLNDDGTREWWLYMDDAVGRVRGPRTPGEMKALYLKGVVGHQTRVRWLPFANAPPQPSDQEHEGFSELREISGDAEPPFMAASTREERAAERAARRKAAEEAGRPSPSQEAATETARHETEEAAIARREREFHEWEAQEAAKAAPAVTTTPPPRPPHIATRAATDRAPPPTLPPPARSPPKPSGSDVVLVGSDDDEGGDDEAGEFWFYVSAAGLMTGPLSAGEMKFLYNRGQLSERTRVRWLPVCFSPPRLADQHIDDTSPLMELFNADGPPFMAAAAVEPQKSAPALSNPGVGNGKDSRVQERLNRARGGPLSHAAPSS